MIAAHGNSLRAICKYLFNISDEMIVKLEIPTGNPIEINLDNDKTQNIEKTSNNLVAVNKIQAKTNSTNESETIPTSIFLSLLLSIKDAESKIIEIIKNGWHINLKK